MKNDERNWAKIGNILLFNLIVKRGVSHLKNMSLG